MEDAAPPLYPVSDVHDIRAACDPDSPLEPNDPRFVDVHSLQHGRGLQELKNILLDTAPGGFHHRCVCGHRGSGKSTELLLLQKWARENGYLAVRVEINDWFGSTSPNATDFFWLAAQVAEQAVEEAGGRLPADILAPVVGWFSEIIKEDATEIKSEIGLEANAQIGTDAFSLAKLFAKLSASIKAGSSHSEKVRTIVRNRPDALVDLTNEVIRQAIVRLDALGYSRGLLILFDNLDRLTPEDIRSKLFQSCDLIKRLVCHAVFVVPIALVYDGGEPIHDYFEEVPVLPMLSLRKRGMRWQESIEASEYESDAVAKLEQVLERRFKVSELLENPEDACTLVRYSGGCLRDLMHLINQASTFRDPGATRISSQAVKEAILRMRRTYKRPLGTEDFKTLAALSIGRLEENREVKHRLLHSRAALAYHNDDGEEWFDVHPTLVETPEFHAAYKQAVPIDWEVY